MTIKKYNQKRNFNATKEPKGEINRSKSNLIFVVQKHAASHLHYDLRLEMEGVLKSWAVPKGPSINPEDKRLAMMVEDHPYSYRNFEGTIPEGNYGAGNVIVWDNGTYNALEVENKEEGEKKLLAGLKKGHISFVLNGSKLKGEFSLVKLKGKQENAWLLIKKNDKFSKDTDILTKNKSVLTNVTLEALQNKVSKTISAKGEGKTKEKIIKVKVPTAEFIKPMLADSIEKPFDDAGWVFEIKYDGYRTLAVINSKEVDLYSRNHISFNSIFKPIAEELKKIKHIVVLDGEVVIEDKLGRSNFQLLQNYTKTKIGILKYYIFDILSLDGNDTRDLSLLERKELLKLLLDKYSLSNVFYSDHILEKGKAFFESAIKNNLEGIIAKDMTSPYRTAKRSSEWLKIKISQQEEAIIVGITEPKGSRNNFGALLLAQYKGKILNYIGNCGTGFDQKTLQELFTKFTPLFVEASPFEEKIKLKGNVQWMKPKLICEVKFSEWTEEGYLRHPVYLGLRTDKSEKEVTKVELKGNEIFLNPKDKKKNSATLDEDKKSLSNFDLKIGKVSLHLTNQDKIYFPEDGITKGAIVNYYNEIAEFILPYLKDRPQSMNRFPNGINEKNFYQKDVDIEKIPSWLKTHKIYSESNDEYIDYLLCNDKATLLYMANLGCIEINPWNSTVKNIENPDWLVIDLDPDTNDFKQVVQTARVVKEIMDTMEVECYCKTSGATGLHIYVPLINKYSYNTVKIFAELIANAVTLRLPYFTSTERAIKKRPHKIYIDALQNRHGQTLAAPYSVRPRIGATVSTPLEWDEVNEKLSPSQFTINNMLKRLDKKGDIWKPVIGKGADINKVMKKLTDAPDLF